VPDNQHKAGLERDKVVTRVGDLNATGLPLEESDLIRNYIFMQVPLDKQEEFQERRWSKLEQEFAGRRDARGVPTEFYRAFCMRGGTYSKQKQTYLDFRTEYQSSIDSPEAAVDQLVRFALHAGAGARAKLRQVDR
jgi:hypothetical protein